MSSTDLVESRMAKDCNTQAGVRPAEVAYPAPGSAGIRVACSSADHDWVESDIAVWCRHCGLIRPWAQKKRTRVPDPITERNRNAWRLLRSRGYERCYWCRERFTATRPPTEDHIRPISKGGRRAHGIVFACQTCNSARGSVDFHAYRAAVDAEHELAAMEHREFRRPRLRKIRDEWVLAAMTNSEVREARAAFGEHEETKPK